MPEIDLTSVKFQIKDNLNKNISFSEFQNNGSNYTVNNFY